MTMPVGSLVTSAAGLTTLLRRRPADSRPAACRIIRGGDADGVIGERVDISTASALGDAINLLLHRAGVGVDVDRDWRHAAEFLLAIARRTAFGSVLMSSRPSLRRASRASLWLGETRWTMAPVFLS